MPHAPQGEELCVHQGLGQGCRRWLGSLFCFLINYNSFPSAASLGLKPSLTPSPKKQLKNLSANAGNMGSIPGLGRSYMPQGNSAWMPPLLSLCSRAQELQLLKPACLKPLLQQEKPPQRQVQAPQLQTSTQSPQLERRPRQQWRPSATKNK